MVLVAHGIVIQSVEQEVPTTVPGLVAPPVTLKDIAGELAENIKSDLDLEWCC